MYHCHMYMNGTYSKILHAWNSHISRYILKKYSAEIRTCACTKNIELLLIHAWFGTIPKFGHIYMCLGHSIN